MQPPSSAVGRIEIAQVPILSSMPAYGAILNSNITFDYLVPLATGSTTNSTNFYSLLNYPESDEFVVQELMANDLLVVGKITSPDWLRFNNSDVVNSISSTTLSNDGGIVTTSTGVVSNPGGAGASFCLGRTGIAIKLTGFPASITVALDIELIYHIEGPPVSGLGNGLSTGAAPLVAVNPTEMSRQVSELARAPAARVIPPWITHLKGAASGIGHGVLDSVNTRLGLGAASGALPKRLGSLGGDAAMLALALKRKGASKIMNALISGAQTATRNRQRQLALKGGNR